MTRSEVERKLIKLEVRGNSSFPPESFKDQRNTAQAMAQMLLWMLTGGFISLPIKTQYRPIITLDIEGDFAQAAWRYEASRGHDSGEYEFYKAKWITTKDLLEAAANITEESRSLLSSNIVLNEVKREARTQKIEEDEENV